MDTGQLDQIAAQVRDEAIEDYGFAEPQRTDFFLMCGEVAYRVHEKLKGKGNDVRVLVLHLNEHGENPGPYHHVAWCDGILIDASITQFNTAAYGHVRLRPLKKDQYAFEAAALSSACVGEWTRVEHPAAYPVGPVSRVAVAGEDEIRRGYYKSRIAVLEDVPTRFSPEAGQPGGKEAILNAWRTGNLGIRRAAMLALPSMKTDASRRLVLDGLTDRDAIIRRHAVEELAEQNATEFAREIEGLQKDSDEAVRLAARRAIEILHGDSDAQG